MTNALLNIPEGSNSGTFSIVVKGDALPEGSGSPLAEKFFVDLISSTGPVTIGADSRGTGTIVDDDNPVSASINDVAVTEGSAPSTVDAIFTVTLSGPAPAPIQIRYSTVNGSAGSPLDYTGVSNALLNIAQGASSGQFSIVVKGDGLPEGAGTPLAENFFVDLISTVGPVTISADSRGTGTIVDDDNPVTASINDVSVTEGHTGTVNATFTVALSGPAPAPLQIRYSTVNGSAGSPGDYQGVFNAQLNIAQGASSGTFSIIVNGDALPEGTGTPAAENFFVDLISSTGPVTITSDSRGTGTIVDDDSPVTASINDVQVAEGNSGTVNATFTVTLSGGAPAPVTIQYTTSNGSATAPSDYTAVTNGVLNIAQGGTGGTFSIVVNGDTAAENTENFFVVITASGATLGDNSGVGTIVDDDTPPPSGGGGGGGSTQLPFLSVDDVAVAETQGATFTITLIGASSKTVTVGYTTSNGTAAASFDYESRSGTLSFAPGQQSQTLTVPVINDTSGEDNETFSVSLTSPVNATILKSLGTATILANDGATATAAGGDAGRRPEPTDGAGAADGDGGCDRRGADDDHVREDVSDHLHRQRPARDEGEAEVLDGNAEVLGRRRGRRSPSGSISRSGRASS